ncbi:hypothetical protein SKAU_G00236530 [Synaphobranchus kaupii]|uniref:Uncharacterized protein n=1 Tax=Synaphobranchus kaupii TaxID=118154 RepID=A0A9Q1F6L7_SYNKA|nr:hypothetical protein SKAU_G00236530 [Synaphobranchus kaupii]
MTCCRVQADRIQDKAPHHHYWNVQKIAIIEANFQRQHEQSQGGPPAFLPAMEHRQLRKRGPESERQTVRMGCQIVILPRTAFQDKTQLHPGHVQPRR